MFVRKSSWALAPATVNTLLISGKGSRSTYFMEDCSRIWRYPQVQQRQAFNHCKGRQSPWLKDTNGCTQTSQDQTGDRHLTGALHFIPTAAFLGTRNSLPQWTPHSNVLPGKVLSNYTGSFRLPVFFTHSKKSTSAMHILLHCKKKKKKTGEASKKYHPQNVKMGSQTYILFVSVTFV